MDHILTSADYRLGTTVLKFEITAVKMYKYLTYLYIFTFCFKKDRTLSISTQQFRSKPTYLVTFERNSIKYVIINKNTGVVRRLH